MPHEPNLPDLNVLYILGFELQEHSLRHGEATITPYSAGQLLVHVRQTSGSCSSDFAACWLLFAPKHLRRIS